MYVVSFFFFQAEDGIRDKLVTGVQTCALPISLSAYYLGNGAAADSVRIALRVPNAIRNLLGEGTLSASFIPVYAALNERPDKAAARALAGAGAGLLLVAAGGLAVLRGGFPPPPPTALPPRLPPHTPALPLLLVRLL